MSFRKWRKVHTRLCVILIGLFCLGLIEARAVDVKFADGTTQSFEAVSAVGDKLNCRTPYGVVNFASVSLAPEERSRFFPGLITEASPTPAPNSNVSQSPTAPTAVSSPSPTRFSVPKRKPRNDVSEPAFSKRSVGSPEFDTKAGRKAAGTAVVVRAEQSSQEFILTVRHLLGPDGGFQKLVEPQDIPAFVKSIDLNGLVGERRHYLVTGLSVPQPKDPKAPLASILAVFKINAPSGDDPAILEGEKPVVGDHIWVVARVRGGVPHGELAHRCVVTESGNRWLVAQFDNPNIITNGASGAPVFDEFGKVVGVYSAHSDQNGKKFAFIIPANIVLKVIGNVKTAASP